MGAWSPNGDLLRGMEGGSDRVVDWAERKESEVGQITLWPSRTIIYCNSDCVKLKEREGEVVWSILALINLSLHPTYQRQ